MTTRFGAVLLGIAVLVSGATLADSGLVTKTSKYSVTDMVNRLEAVLKSSGMTVFARIDHRAEAEKVGPTMPPAPWVLKEKSMGARSSGGGASGEFSVLLVDDERDFLETLIKRLQRRKLKVTGATSGEEALRILKKMPPDVVVLDVRMEGMNGIKTLREIKKTSPLWR